MELRLRTVHVSPDLIPGHPAAVLVLIILLVADSLFSVTNDLIAGALILFAANTVVTLIWSYRQHRRVNGDLLSSIVLRFVSYCAVGVSIVVFSNMTSIFGEKFRTLMLAGIAAIELIYTMHLTARMFERFRPIYVGMLDVLDRSLPFDFGTKEVEDAMNGNEAT